MHACIINKQHGNVCTHTHGNTTHTHTHEVERRVWRDEVTRNLLHVHCQTETRQEVET